MKIVFSPAGRKFTEGWEGRYGQAVLASYQDNAGVWTIGFGHTKGVTEGMTCTSAQADAWMSDDAAEAVAACNALITVALNQNEADAIIDFEFNTGGLDGSRVLRLINTERFDEVPAEMAKWCHARVNGVETIIKGLVRRRAADGALWSALAPITVSPIVLSTPSLHEGIVPTPPPTHALQTTTGKLQLGSLVSGGAAAVGAAMNQVQPAVDAVHRVQAVTGGLHGPLLYAVGGCVAASVGFTVWTLVRKQWNVTGKL